MSREQNQNQYLTSTLRDKCIVLIKTPTSYAKTVRKKHPGRYRGGRLDNNRQKNISHRKKVRNN